MVTWRLALYDSDEHTPEYVAALLSRVLGCERAQAEELAVRLHAEGKLALAVEDEVEAREGFQALLGAGPDPARPDSRASLVVALEQELEGRVTLLERVRERHDGREPVSQEEIDRLLLTPGRYAPSSDTLLMKLPATPFPWLGVMGLLVGPPLVLGGAARIELWERLPWHPGGALALLPCGAFALPLLVVAVLASRRAEAVELHEHCLCFLDTPLRRVPWSSLACYCDRAEEHVRVLHESGSRPREELVPTPDERARTILLELLVARGVPRRD